MMIRAPIPCKEVSWVLTDRMAEEFLRIELEDHTFDTFFSQRRAEIHADSSSNKTHSVSFQ